MESLREVATEDMEEAMEVATEVAMAAATEDTEEATVEAMEANTTDKSLVTKYICFNHTE